MVSPMFYKKFQNEKNCVNLCGCQGGRCAKVTVHLNSENRTRVRQILRFVPKTMVLMTITIIV